LDGARGRIEAAGARLVLIGQATPRHAAHFRRRRNLNVLVLADEKRVSYEAAGAKKGSVAALVAPRIVAKGAMVTARTGMVQGRTIGRASQLGGAMVIAPDGQVVWSRMARDAADNASAAEIGEAVGLATRPAGAR
jgi:peroxiredoxin